jgi:hypothetical protein
MELKKNCKICKKEFSKPYTASLKRWNEGYKTCSWNCANLNKTGKHTSKLGMKMDKPAWNKGLKSNRPAWNKGNGDYAKKLGFGKWMNGKTQSLETRLKKSLATRGEKGNNWQGGITKKNNTIRRSLEYRLWREEVMRRDNWTCIWCTRRGCELHADHILPFAKFPELRFELNNGRTLCVPCHSTTNTYKGKTR